MEKPNKPKNLFLKFLPKAYSAVNFQNPSYSPGRDHHYHSSTKLKANAYKGFSGPINFAVLPDEAREKTKNGNYDPQEPTSPKISCMGQIKYKHKRKKLMKAASKNATSSEDHHNKQSTNKSKDVKRSGSAISKLFSKSPKPARKVNGSSTSENDKDVKLAAQDKRLAPNLGHMKKFASGRESLANFDWTSQIAPIDHDRDCYSDEERRRDSDDEEDEEEREVIIPYSAPMLIGGRGGGLSLEPRKEVNLWKRRTMDPPSHLALYSKG